MSKDTLITQSGEPIECGSKEVPRAVGETRTGSIVESEEPIVNKDGEFNASNSYEVMGAIKRLHQSIINKTVTRTVDVVKDKIKEISYILSTLRKDYVHNKKGKLLVEQLYQDLYRQAFARKLLTVTTVGKKEVLKVKLVNKKEGKDDQFMYTDAFDLSYSLLFDADEDLNEIYDEVYSEAFKNIIGEEDKRLLGLIDASYSLRYSPEEVSIDKCLTPTDFSTLRTILNSMGLEAFNCVFPFNFWDDMLTDTEFATWFDPVNKYKLVMEGTLGSLMGINLYTDGFRNPDRKVLPEDEIIMLADPKHLGVIGEQKALTGKNIDKYAYGENKIGWFIHGKEAMVVSNPLAIVKGKLK